MSDAKGTAARGANNALLAAIEKTVRMTPDAPAYKVSGEPVTTYAELWRKASAVARGLLAEVSGRGPVVVLGPKSALTVEAFLACLMSGHAYVPLDAELPAQLVCDIAGQIEDAVFLSAEPLPAELARALTDVRLLDAAELAAAHAGAPAPDPSTWVTGDETQYIIFTSGSTGRPKGIEISEANVANFQRWLVTFPVIADGGRAFLDQAHYSFDLSEYELMGALSTGGCLCAVTAAEAVDFRALFSALATSGVEVWVSTPSFADLCLADPSFASELLPDLRLFLFCGEPLHHTTVSKLLDRFDQARVANTYGPTESTVAVTYGEIGDAELADAAPLPVGLPRPGTELRIVDHETGEPVPCGTTGEIVICGDTVARGYYRNPEKTAEAFFDSRMADGTPMRAYRTGDLGHLDEAGILHCAGRLDSLVKLNGFRIELSEVEGALEAVGCVRQACVVPVERGGRVTSLCAFVACDRGRAAADLGLAGAAAGTVSDFALGRALKSELARTLPPYMVPRQVRVMDALPVTERGKCDRKALAASIARPARPARA